MSRSRSLILAAVAAVLLVLLVGWFVGVGAPSAPPPAAPASPAPVAAKPAPAVPPVPAAPPAPAPPLEDEPVQALFPDERIFRCDAPADVPEGRLRAGPASVLVSDGQTLVVASEEGGELVQLLGRTVGQLAWSGDTCSWDVPDTVRVVGTVDGGGVHAVAGCPVGEVLSTDADGRFTVDIPKGQSCTLRTVSQEGEVLAMGDTLILEGTTDETVTLTPPEPLDDALVARAQAMLTEMTVRRIDALQGELDHWSQLDAEEPLIAWMLEQVQQELTFFEGERQRLQDEEEALEVVAEFLFSEGN